MIRFRRAVNLASGAAAALFGPLWKYRVVVTCPPAESITLRPVRESSPKDSFSFGPGDSGWVTFDEKYTGILIEKASGAAATVDVWWADEKADEVHPGGGANTSPVGAVLYDSGSVAAGAAIDSGVLDLSTVGALQIIVDNTAGTVLRDLSLLSYLTNGTTLIDSVMLRRCAFGAAPTGSVYAPGAIRGLVSPMPPGETTGVHVLYDVTSGVNAALDTGPLSTEDLASVFGFADCSAGTCVLTAFETDDAGAYRSYGAPAAAATNALNWTPGATGTSFNVLIGGTPPRRARLTTSAAGAGNTVRLRICGRGRAPGTFSHPMVLPTRAKVTLGAGGAGAARLTVIGR